jgi:hypothetical protein
VYCFEVQIVAMALGSAASSSDSVGVCRSLKVKNRLSSSSSSSLFNDAFLASQTIYTIYIYILSILSILIRLPSSSETGETQVRNMAEFCRRAPLVLGGFFNVP